jgi:CRISPR/Cas system-associated endoribonuclease Cas2
MVLLYVRSLYFNKEKVFLDLIQNSKFEPTSKENPNKRSEILHRFAGITSEKDLFFVQIKENKQSGTKWFMSVFPVDDR